MRRVNRQTRVSGLERKIAMQTNFSLRTGIDPIPGEKHPLAYPPGRMTPATTNK